MRKSIEDLLDQAKWYGTNLEDKDIELRYILIEMLRLLDEALPKEVEPD